MTIREVPASIGQRVLWQMDHHRGGYGALNCPLMLRLDGPLDVDVLEVAVDGLARRHESLRTTFTGRGPRLTQLIHSQPLPMPVRVVDLASQADPVSAADAALAGEVQTPTDPAERPLRLTLWRLAPERHVLCLTMHHLITDGWSTAVICNELGQLYGRVAGDGAPLPTVGWQYAEWVNWHQQQLQGEALRALQAYWRNRLAGARLPGLPRQDSDVPLLERRTAIERARLEPDTLAPLRAFARSRGTAFFTCLLAIYYALLERQLGEGDYAVGSIFANRSRREAQATVGFLSNMVVLRSQVPQGVTFESLVGTADEAVVGAFAHQALPFQMLPLDTIDSSSMRPDAIVFQLFTGPMAAAVHAGLRFEPIVDVPDRMGSRWEFELSVAPDGDGMAVLLCYAEDLYDSAWARRFVDSYVELAGAMARNRHARIDSAPVPA